jgi:glycosyltransferase involved in cell wall biosynthesis
MTRVPKICIITETYYPVVGGGETQAWTLAEGLVANGLAVTVLTRRSDASFRKIEQFGQVTVYRLPPTGHEHLRKWGLVFTSLPALIRLRHQYDLIFVSGFRVLGISAVLVSKLFRKACVLKADSQGEMSGAFFAGGLARLRMTPSSFPIRVFLAIRNKILRHADSFVAICNDIASELTTHGVNSKAIHLVPNMVDTRKFRPVDQHAKQLLRSRLAVSQENTIITYTGRLVSYKGLPLLMEVWRELQGKRKNISLLLLGSGGIDIHNCEAELKAYVRSHGLQESVHFAGDVRNVHEYLQASDIFIFPTESDAFPLALVEAMACGLPVISTPVGGIKDIITHLHDGVIVEAGNYQQIHNALDAVITDTALAARLGAAAWRTVQDRYSAENVTQKYVTLFTEVANPSGKSLSLAN